MVESGMNEMYRKARETAKHRTTDEAAELRYSRNTNRNILKSRDLRNSDKKKIGHSLAMNLQCFDLEMTFNFAILPFLHLGNYNMAYD